MAGHDRNVLMLVGVALVAFGLDAAPAHAQSAPAPRDPRIEIGAQFSATSVPTESAWTAGPRVSFLLTDRTAVDVSADANRTRQQFHVQLARTLWRQGSGTRVFATGGAGVAFRRQPFSAGPERLFLGGIGVERTIAPRLSVRGDLQLQLSGDDVRPRVSAGLNVPIGGNPRPRDIATTAPPTSPLPRIRAGRRVSVTTLDGRETVGEVAGIDSDRLTIRGRDASSQIPLTSIKRIETPDPLGNGIRNGTIIGTIAAVTPVALLLNAYGDCPCDSTVPVVTGFAALGAGVGAIAGAVIDSLRERRHTLYESSRGRHLTVSPIMTRNSAGAIVRW